MVTYASPLIRKLSAFTALSTQDESILIDLHRKRRRLSAGRELMHEGQTSQSAYILASGWGYSYKLMTQGRRQIVGFQVPGDILGLRALLFRASDHNIVLLTGVEVSEVVALDLTSTFARNPKLAFAVLWSASRDEAMVLEHMVGLGRRTAAERTAHFFLELGARLKLVGMGDSTGYSCPLNQCLLADALGMSIVHVSRTLRDLREGGLMSFRRGRVQFDDYQGLVTLADFHPAYLDQDGPLLV